MLNLKKQIILGIFLVSSIFGQINGIGITLGGGSGENALMSLMMGGSNLFSPTIYGIV